MEQTPLPCILPMLPGKDAAVAIMMGRPAGEPCEVLTATSCTAHACFGVYTPVTTRMTLKIVTASNTQPVEILCFASLFFPL